MMRYFQKICFFAVFILFLLPAAPYAQTYINTNAVSGTWTLSGSPYIIQNDIYVPSGQCLQVEAGVVIRFDGLYRLIVDGCLQANGNIEGHIVFCASDTTGWHDNASGNGGWRGIRFKPAVQDSSFLRFCEIKDLKEGTSIPTIPQNDGTLGICVERPLRLSNCIFTHNESSWDIIKLLSSYSIDTSAQIVFDSCTFFDNWSGIGLQAWGSLIANSCQDSTTVYIRDCSLHDNHTGNTIANMPVHPKTVVTGCEIFNNEYEVNCAAVFGMGGESLKVEKSHIHHNVMDNTGAISAYNVGEVYIDDNFIYNNHLAVASNCGATNGGAAIRIGNDESQNEIRNRIRNNVIVNNESSFVGGAMAFASVNVLLSNNTIVNNRSVDNGGAIYAIFETQITAVNNIFYGNEGAGQDSESVYLFSPGISLTFNHNFINTPLFTCIKHLYPLTLGDTSNNVVSDGAGLKMLLPTTQPGIIEDASGADFSLNDSSLCVNAGDSSGASCLQNDIAMLPRIVGHIDIGAYENQSDSGSVNGILPTKDLKHVVLLYPNPVGEMLTVTLPLVHGAIQITDLSGRVRVAEHVRDKNMFFSVRSLKSGIYYFQWFEEGKVITTPFVVSR